MKIAAARTICTAPEGIGLVVVKVETDEPGCYGVGCATFTQRPQLVVRAVEEYLEPFLVGRDPDDIEDIWRAAQLSSYWRHGPVLNNALAGVDMALWDIKGKRAGMPVHGLLGGRARRFAEVYTHVSGRDAKEVEEGVRRRVEEGYRFVRCQMAVGTTATYGASTVRGGDAHFDPRAYCTAIPRLFEHLRNELSESVELLHDVHERLAPPLAVQLAKDLEPYRLFFLEDVLAPEDQEYLRHVRAQSSVPLALGELYTSPHEYLPVVRDRLVDFMRAHLSDIGGITPARKLAAICELFGIRTAWHGPGDASPVAHAANLALDIAVPNFGIHEWPNFGESAREVFPGCPEVRDGALHPNLRPGLGVDIDEQAAARYPLPDDPLRGSWREVRLRDGTVVRP
jgi:mannonate dehydratase